MAAPPADSAQSPRKRTVIDLQRPQYGLEPSINSGAADLCSTAQERELVMWLLTLALVNCFLGALVGIRYRVWIIIPLSAIAILEVAILEFREATWTSILWHAGALIVSIELGYLVGSAIGAYLADRHFPVTARPLNRTRVSSSGLLRRSV